MGTAARKGRNERIARVLLISVIVSLIITVISLIRCSSQSGRDTVRSKLFARQAQPQKKSIPSPPSLQANCSFDNYVYPSWPEGFNVSVEAAFILGEQKSGSTWLWEMLNAHPCVLSSARPYKFTGAITTKETYYFTSLKISPDARQFLVPWMGYDGAYSMDEAAWKTLDSSWFEKALRKANVGSATTNAEFVSKRSYTGPVAKLVMKETCPKYYILEATPHNLNSPVVAKRIKGMFPNAKLMAILKEPVWRMQSAYNQFSRPFLSACNTSSPAPWCPAYRYYQLKLPTFEENARQEVAYIKKSDCAMSDANGKKGWMDCFGCGTMDPWRHNADGIHIGLPPYVPSAALGMYAPLLKAWAEFFPLDEMRVFNYQDLVGDPLGIVNQLLEYLGLEHYTEEHMSILSPQRLGFKGSGARPLPEDVMQLLGEFYRPLNEQLDEMLSNHPIPWHAFNSSIRPWL